jgi:hypothetical protein
MKTVFGIASIATNQHFNNVCILDFSKHQQEDYCSWMLISEHFIALTEKICITACGMVDEF